MDQVSLASVMMRLLCWGQLGLSPPGRFRPGDAAFQYGMSDQLLWSFSWKLLVSVRKCDYRPGDRPGHVRDVVGGIGRGRLIIYVQLPAAGRRWKGQRSLQVIEVLDVENGRT